MSNDIRDIFKKINELSVESDNMQVGDSFDIELSENFNIETGIVGFTDDGVIVEADESMLAFLDFNGVILETIDYTKNTVYLRKPDGTMTRYLEESEQVDEGRLQDVDRNDIKLWAKKSEENKKKYDMYLHYRSISDKAFKDRDGALSTGAALEADLIRNDIVKAIKAEREQGINEAEYQGRKVSLGKPFLTPDGPKKRSVYVRKPNGKVVKVNFGDKNMKIKKSNPKRRKSFRARHNCDNPGPRWRARYWSCRKW